MRKLVFLVALGVSIAALMFSNFARPAGASKATPDVIKELNDEPQDGPKPLAPVIKMPTLIGVSGQEAKPLSKTGQSSKSKTARPPVEADEKAMENDPDLPSKPALRGGIDTGEYLRRRNEYIALLRGIDPLQPIPVGDMRAAAIGELNERQETIRKGASKGVGIMSALVAPTWTELGPKPIPNGQYQSGLQGSVTGRVTAIVVDPTNSSIVYIGTAQGGVWRSTDGGTSWTNIFDTAQSLAIGAIAIAPSDPTKLYVGTGEPNNSCDSYIGVGLYRIDNANTSPTLVGPINPSMTFFNTAGTATFTTTAFGGRSISQILVNPTDPATIFVSTAAAVAGSGCNALSNTVGPLGLRGVYRSTNATSAAGSITFEKLKVANQSSLDQGLTGNTSISDMAFEPGNPNNLLVAVQGSASPGGGVFRSTNALATPGTSVTFTGTLLPGFTGLWMRLAINKVGSTVTVVVSSNEPSSNATCAAAGNAGRVRKSTDGGATWGTPLAAAEGYCGGQCSYDDPIGIDPEDANIIYVGGNAEGTCSDVLKRSGDGGATFTRDDTGLHADSHYIFIDPLPASPTPNNVWFVTDGGVWERADAAAGTPWTSKNNAPLSITQFVSVAVHPTDRNYTLGGTQDNGTEYQDTSGTWVSAEGGDGGFAQIDQSSTDIISVNQYHTFFNSSNAQILFDRATLTSCDAVKDSWPTRGAAACSSTSLCANDTTPSSCDGTAGYLNNGIRITDNVLFYAPMVLGPGSPNTLYFGTDRLYRSTDKGDTMAIVSQSPINATGTRSFPGFAGGAAQSVGVPISAIAVADSTINPGADDRVRVVGLQNGQVWATATGSSTLVNTNFPAPTNATGSTTNKFVSRIAVDPNNTDIAYVALSYYTSSPTAGQVWKTTSLSSATPAWTSSSSGLPNVPINAMVIDPAKHTRLFVGTDIGVYISEDSGATWNPYGTGLPRVAVFDVAIQPSSHILRIATHGRGMWEITIPNTISGTVTNTDGTPLGGVTVQLSGTATDTTVTAPDGTYYFPNTLASLPDGSYTITPSRTHFTFAPPSRGTSVSGGSISSGQDFTGTLTATEPQPVGGPVLISEFRLSGPALSTDEFIELYNNTNSAIDISGYSVDTTSGSTFTVPSVTNLPARSHYLLVGSGYALAGYAAADQSYAADLPMTTGLALYDASSNIVDAVGFTSQSSPYREGAGLAPLGVNTAQYSFARKLTSGLPQDTGNNASDFVLVATDPATLSGSTLGAPGPENLASPLNRGALVKPRLLDAGAPIDSPPNRDRNTTANNCGTGVTPTGNCAAGTLTVRRSFINNTGTTLTKLRFRVVDMTAGPASVGTADLRLLTSPTVIVTTSSGNASVAAMTLDTPPTQALGGGLNSSITATLPGGILAPGNSINVQFTLGVQQTGSFRFFVIVEALP